MNNGRISIAIIISRFDKCGPNRVLLPIIKEMKIQQYDVCILALFRERADGDFDSFIKAGVNIKQANISSNKKICAIRREIRKCIRQWNPDIVYSSGLSANYHMAKVVKDILSYCTLHNNAYVDLRYGFNQIMVIFGEYMTNYAIRHTEFVICCSRTLQGIYQERFPQKEIYCIQNGIDTARFQCLDMKVREKKNKVVFFVSGSLNNRKDPLTIIKAFKRAGIADKAMLMFAGTGELKQQCEDLAKESSIAFLGYKNDIEKYYQLADVYISASHSEGLPNSVLEAASCGCRMILSDIPQHREIFKEHYDLVSFFEKGNVEKLSELFQKNIRITQQQEREKISRYINDNFSSVAMAKKYCDFIRENSGGGE